MIRYASTLAVGILLSTSAFAQQVMHHKAMPLPMAPSDFSSAVPMPLPKALNAPSTAPSNAPAALGLPGSSAGGVGTGEMKSSSVPQSIKPDMAAVPEQFGSSNQPFTTSRDNPLGVNISPYYPFRAAGRLFFKIGASTFVCSASLIKPGVVVTAAHCVANFGKKQFYNSWQFIPAYDFGGAPYGVWTAADAIIMTAYYDGSDSCAQSGVVCRDDMAVIILNPQGGHYAGQYAGWYGYGWNGYSYSSWMGFSQAAITQLGYPVALDGGNRMERTDSMGYNAGGDFSNNTIIGSLMTGGSSGGPWTVNFGLPPALSGVAYGNAAAPNIVVGVTSWGYISTVVKQEGAAPFTSGNIVPLVNAACGAFPAAC